MTGFTVTPLGPLFGAKITGLDLRRLDDPEPLLAVLDRYAVCVVPHDSPPTDEEHIAYSLKLGPIEGREVLTHSGGKGPRIPHYEIIDQSNLDETGSIYADDDRRLAFKRANRLWHTDMSFHPNRATYSLLAAHVVPPEPADTQFADMRAVYDALPEATKARLEGQIAEHSYWYSRVLGGGPPATQEELDSRPPARHALVHVHPRSGRKVLYIASHVSGIVGWPEDEARDLVAELMAFATRPEFVLAHRWTVGDVVIWDNLATMHRATPYDDRVHVRDVRRTTCREAAA